MVSSLFFGFTLLIHSVICSRFVAYVDWPTCDGETVKDADCLEALGVPGYANHPYNVINFAFYVTNHNTMGKWKADALDRWATPTSYFTSTFMDTVAGKSGASDAEFRSAVKSLYSNAGVKLMVSVMGATDHAMGGYSNPKTTLASDIATIVTTYEFDGVDIDWEETAYFRAGTGEQWLCDLTTELRSLLGSSYLITHAPMVPYFEGSTTLGYSNGAYLTVHATCGDDIDWYNIQFYNQGTSSTYDTYELLFNNPYESIQSCCSHSAVNQMINGDNPSSVSIPGSKIVIGKPCGSGDASNGWVSASSFASILSQGLAQTSPVWDGGFMIWQYKSDLDQNFAFGNTVSAVFPSGTTVSPKPTSPPIPTPKPTSKPTIDPCAAKSIVIESNVGTMSQWWYAAYVNDVTTGYTISAFDVWMGSYWLACSVQTAGYWGCSFDKLATYPLTVRLTSGSDTLTKNDVITSTTGGAKYDFGDNFGTGTGECGDADPTKSPVKDPTKSPVNSPTKSPVNSPTKSPQGNRPTERPTTSPEDGSSGTRLRVNNYASSSKWWYAVTFDNVPDGVTIKKVEMKDARMGDWAEGSSSWITWQFSPSGGPFETPLDFKVTDQDGNTVTGYDLITSFDDGEYGDFSTNFNSASNVAVSDNDDGDDGAFDLEADSNGHFSWIETVVICLIALASVGSAYAMYRLHKRKKGIASIELELSVEVEMKDYDQTNTTQAIVAEMPEDSDDDSV